MARLHYKKKERNRKLYRTGYPRRKRFTKIKRLLIEKFKLPVCYYCKNRISVFGRVINYSVWKRWLENTVGFRNKLNLEES